jgi:hypothetical protein
VHNLESLAEFTAALAHIGPCGSARGSGVGGVSGRGAMILVGHYDSPF